MGQAILQFGTGRFLLAHVDLFVSEALSQQQAIGGIAVVQTTGSEQSSARLAALATGQGYPVQVRGLKDGQPIEQHLHANAIRQAWHADRDWPQVLEAMATSVQVIVSNTAESGYRLDAADGPAVLHRSAAVPRSYPAKLLALLQHRWRHHAAAPLSIYPCELVSRNADTLRDLVLGLAAGWGAPAPFLAYVRDHCVWVNSLVDRIVSEPLHPIGAIAEPYALWAIERRAGMVLPCSHPAIVLTDELGRFERLKLMLLNLGHTFLAEQWLVHARPANQSVYEAMHDSELRPALEAVWHDEVLPVFDALGEGDAARAYVAELRDRLLNPFLKHQLADISQHHANKKLRRIAPLLALADEHGLPHRQPRLRAMMQAA